MSDLLELETRKKIYNLIKENPGINLSQISEILDLSSQLIDYHLNYLSNHGLITFEVKAGYKRCYIKGSIGHEEKQVLSLLRQEIPLKIVLYLLKYPYSRHRDILKFINVSSPRFSYHLKKLIKNNVIELVSVGRKKGYVVKNEREIVRLIIEFKPSNVYKMIRDTWVDFGPG